MPRKFKAAVIGCGNVSGFYGESDKGLPLSHAGTYMINESTDLVAIVDKDIKKINTFNKRWDVKSSYVDLIKMLTTHNPDIVSVCTPPETHLSIVKKLVENQVKGIICEKPLAHNIEDAKKIVELVRDNCVMTVNYFRRWNKSFYLLKQKLNEGIIGDVRSITVHYTKGLLSNGSHLINLLEWLFGMPVDYSISKVFIDKDGDRGINFSTKFKPNIECNFIHLPITEYVFINIDLFGTEGRVEITQRGQEVKISKKEKDHNYQIFNKLELIEEEQTNWDECLISELEELIKAIEQGSSKVSCSPKEALSTLIFCQTIYQESLKLDK